MTTEQAIVAAGAIAIGILVLLGAALVWRALGRIGIEVRALDARLAEAPARFGSQLVAVRTAASEIDAAAERTLVTLARADVAFEATDTSLRARRDASDRLRARLMSGQANLARLRQTIRLVIRVNDLRREFWA